MTGRARVTVHAGAQQRCGGLKAIEGRLACVGAQKAGWQERPLFFFTLLCAAGCMQSPAIDRNSAPKAVAWVDDADHPIPTDERGAVDQVARSAGLVLEHDGSPVTVTLDATGSSDRDGEVVRYTWLSANFGPNCTGRDVEPEHDPDDEARPPVTLEQGFWQFSLWVEDDRGEVSDPSVVTIRVGTAAVDPCPGGPASVVGDDAGAGSTTP